MLAAREIIHSYAWLGDAPEYVISWRSKKQVVTAKSTLEAEFVSMSFAVREGSSMASATWRRCLRFESTVAPTVIFGDNEGALDLAYNDVVNDKSKHIAVKYFYSGDKVGDGSVMFNNILTDESTSEIMTKILGPKVHEKMTAKLGMKMN